MINLFNMLGIMLISGALLTSVDLLSRYSIAAKVFAADATAGQPTMVLAKNTGKKPSKAGSATSTKPGGKPKTLTGEKIYRGESKKVDFDSIDIGGERKTPYGSMINQTKANKDYDLIRVRLRWHDEMKQSTSSLENGRAGS